MGTIDRKNLVVGLIYLGLAIASGIAAYGYRLGTIQRMGAGYFPMLAASGLGLVGLIITIKALIPTAREQQRLWGDLRIPLAVCSATVLFGLLLKPAGLAIGMIVLVGLANLGNPERDWRITTLSLLTLIPSCWVIFILLLKLPLTLLPAGWGM